ncbi:MAG: YihA family ribosome biogenesis GTP-binding protein, partial [Mediterranea sp.]|nr:YihA family ribosome biogenesis GTP-binding protein [Mediterranea sp.]
AIVFTKADKIKAGTVQTQVANYLKVLAAQWEELPPYFVTSSQNKSGRKELIAYIDQINKELK